MRVLIVTHIFWPEGADFKNFALAKELVARGHSVTVVTAFPSYPLGRVYDGYKLAWRQWERAAGVKILRVPLYPDHSSSGVKRFLNYGSFTLSASTIGVMLAGKADVVFVYSPPMTLGLTAGCIKALHGAPILLDVVDLWPDAIVGSGMVRSRFLVASAGCIARSAYHLADRITVPTAGFQSRLEASGVPRKKISVVPNWADGAPYSSAERNREFGERHGIQDKFCIIHAGNIGPFQDIRNVLAAAELLRDVAGLRIVFVGGGRDADAMKREKEARGLDNVIFAGTYPAEQMPGILAWGEALLVSLRSDPYLLINVPSKVAACLAAGKPIIACVEGETRRAIADNDVGLTCSPGNPALLAETIGRFMALSDGQRSEMGKRSRLTFERCYDKDILIGEYVSLLETLACRR